ncbi:hypothetical protein POM88_032430 [Heracleum sosnowskyi]|uniref:Uncharacterized protein n=1 Tax=Heracleum sosnowskyi TaxID=360622 RepID=A0AAD8HZ96_9APIA|nr:hypothetical protein POM88_032430 [Heracleum sosnowskyi]
MSLPRELYHITSSQPSESQSLTQTLTHVCTNNKSGRQDSRALTFASIREREREREILRKKDLIFEFGYYYSTLSYLGFLYFYSRQGLYVSSFLIHKGIDLYKEAV